MKRGGGKKGGGAPTDNLNINKWGQGRGTNKKGGTGF